MEKKEKKVYSKDLGIDLDSENEEEFFKWFLASLLFGKPIQQEIAVKAYHELINEGLVTPEKIQEAGWDKLVEILDRAHYVRYDFSTATKLLDVSKELIDKYGTVNCLLYHSKTKKDLSKRLQEFKGIGPVTAEIFSRDIRPKILKYRTGRTS